MTEQHFQQFPSLLMKIPVLLELEFRNFLVSEPKYLQNIPLVKVFDSKLSLDKELGCTWHVIVGQDFSADILYEVSSRHLIRLDIANKRGSAQEGSMLYVMYGSLAMLLWKCGSQLLSEANYRVRLYVISRRHNHGH